MIGLKLGDDYQMKLQTKYNLLHVFYWMSVSCITGFVAIFLEYRGMNNTEIGIVTGGGSIFSIFLSPYVSSLVTKFKGLTLKKLILLIDLVMVVDYIVISFLPIPIFMIMLLYILLCSLSIATVPLITMVAMNYVQNGKDVNFGTARGIGSASWATFALVFGQLVSIFSPRILFYAFVGLVLATTVLMHYLPDIDIKTEQEIEMEVEEEIKSRSIFSVIKAYPIFISLLIGFCLMFSAATMIGTYLINIVKNLGGNTSTYGIACFFMALSELPVMIFTPRLMRRYHSLGLILIASFFFICRNFIISFAPNIFILILGMMFQGLSYGLFTGVITYYVTYSLDKQDHMAGQTLIGIMTSGLGATMGNVFGGFLQDTFGITSMFIYICLATFLGFCVIMYTYMNNKSRFKRRTRLNI